MAWRGSSDALGNQSSGYAAGVNMSVSAPSVQVGNSQWHPTVLYLGVLVVVEMVVFGYISHFLD